MSFRALFVRVLLSTAFAASVGAARADGIFEEATKKAVLFYQDNICSRPTGVFDNDGWTYFHARLPFDKTAKGRQAAQQAARRTHDKLLLRWMIDRALEKRGEDAQVLLSPGASLVRNLVRVEEPSWEFESAKIPPVSLQQLADQVEDGMFVVASGGRTEKLLAAVPTNLGEPWPTTRWAAAAKDAVRLRYRAAPEAFIAEAGALDLLSVRKNDVRGTFPSVESESFPRDIEAFVKTNADSSKGSASAEMTSFMEALANYAGTSPDARRFRDRALSLQLVAPSQHTVLSTLAVVEKTNCVVSVVTNWIDRAETKTNRTVRPLAASQTLRGAVPYGGRIFLERTSTPKYTVTTNETITISRQSDVMAENVRVSETGRPQFERLFLSAGTLPNVASPQTDRGRAAIALFYTKGVRMEAKESALMDALGENPGDKNLWNYLGRIFQEREDWLGAAICFRNALRLDPEFDYALTNLADCHKMLGNVNLAVGTAVLARGLATNDWCEKRAAAILEAPEKSFGVKK